MTRRPRGFTLVELMVVVTLLCVISAIAVVSMRRGRSGADADSWAASVRNLATQARRRAIATGKDYLLEVADKKLRWCQVPDDGGICGNAIQRCDDPPAAGQEMMAKYLSAPADAVTDSIASAADQISTIGVTPVAITHVAIPSQGSKPVYFLKDGTVTLSYCTKANPTGATVYVRASNSVSSANVSSETQKRRRIAINGISGRPRIIDSW